MTQQVSHKINSLIIKLLFVIILHLQSFASCKGATNVGDLKLLPFAPYEKALSQCERPIHDWTVHIFGQDFGLTQWTESCCHLYCGHRILSIGCPASQVVVLSVSLTVIMVAVFSVKVKGGQSKQPKKGS